MDEQIIDAQQEAEIIIKRYQNQKNILKRDFIEIC